MPPLRAIFNVATDMVPIIKGWMKNDPPDVKAAKMRNKIRQKLQDDDDDDTESPPDEISSSDIPGPIPDEIPGPDIPSDVIPVEIPGPDIPIDIPDIPEVGVLDAIGEFIGIFL